jgi:hypothetical protein
MSGFHHRNVRSKSAVRWQHLLFVKGEMTISCDVELRGEGTYTATLFPLWSPADQVTETFTDPADAARWHARMAQRLQEAGWLLHGGGVVTTAA